jgi:pimeloyl-ACP methyl ester carboxylesterase
MLNSVESDSVFSLIDFNRLSNMVSVVRYDACNKSASGDFSWPAMTNELIGVADHLNFSSMILGGCSMGSGTAIHAAVRFPERVRGLVLLTPPPAWEYRKQAQSVYRKVSMKTDPNKLPEFLKRILELNDDPPEFFEEMFPGTRKRLLEMRLSFEPAYYKSIYHGGAVSDFPSREQIAQIRVPTLIVSNPEDDKHPIRVSHEINELIPNSEMVVISDFTDYKNLQFKLAEFIGSLTDNNKS